MRKSTRETLFFIIVFLLFYLANKLHQFWSHKSHLKGDLSIILIGCLFTLSIVSVFFIARLQTHEENFWDISDYAKCKGGPYFWQGDSATSKMCKQLASTPEGRIGLSSYNCPTGYVGQPGLPFYYSPLSGDKWTNERCEDIPSCQGVDVGLCSLEKQVE